MSFVRFRTILAFGSAILAAAPALGARGPGVLPFTEPSMEEVYVSDDGTVALAWMDEEESNESGARIFEVRRWAMGGDEGGEDVLVYEGPDTATFLSGLPQGVYRLKVRARAPEGEYPAWGDDYLSVEVNYIESWLVVTLMSFGLVTFLAIIGAIVFGHRQVSRNSVMPEREHEPVIHQRT